MKPSSLPAWAIVAGGWAVMLLSISFFRPLMPVDETRYMSVAWEMLVQNHWLLPTLNFEPYSHKPPLLFWIIRGAWALGDIGITPVRVALSGVIMGLFYLTFRLTRTLVPQNKQTANNAILLLAGLPVFVIYASMIMFDSLLAVFVLLGWLCIWHASQTKSWKPWLGLGAAIGVGILAKGPVALVYILPVALLAPVWASLERKSIWYGRMMLSVLIGACIGLAWAIPTAIIGGAAYAEKIFLTQSAGRMVNAFDHVRPFWFYILAILGFLAPLLVWPAFWSQIRTRAKALWQNNAARFLACAIVPVFVFFSTISSKQIHYMLPLLPGVAILAAMMLESAQTKLKSVWLPIALSALPSVAILGLGISGLSHWGAYITPSVCLLAFGHLVLIGVILLAARRVPAFAAGWLALSAFVLVALLHMQLGQRFLPSYSMMPLKAEMATRAPTKLAVMYKYDGEYGYILRLTKPITVWNDNPRIWFEAHPDSLIIARKNLSAAFPHTYNIVFDQPFRRSHHITLLAKPGTP